MALSGTGLAALVYKDYLAAMPTASTANRSNVVAGIPTHNVPFELVSAISKGFSTALLSMLVSDNYVGSAGGGSSTLTPPIFNPGLVTQATTTFTSSMGWAGSSAALFTNVMINLFFVNVTANVQIQMNPLPGAGPGTGLVTPGSNPSLSTSMTSSCSAAIIAEIAATNKFNLDDIIGGSPTPQIALLATNLSTAYGTIVGGVTAAIPYVGTASTPTSPLTAVNSGKFI